jgi:hypothetical protein
MILTSFAPKGREMNSRREVTARRREEKDGRRRKLSLVQVRRIGCPSRLRRDLEDRSGVIYSVKCER